MTDKRNKTTKGWHENRDVLLGKAPLHQEAALKKKFDEEQISESTDIVPVPDEGDKVTLRYEYSEEFKDIAGQFEEDNDVLLEIDKDGDDIIVEIPVEHSADFIEFLAENGIKEKDETEEAVDDEKTINVCDKDDKEDKDVAVDSSLELKYKVDNIIADVKTQYFRR